MRVENFCNISRMKASTFFRFRLDSPKRPLGCCPSRGHLLIQSTQWKHQNNGGCFCCNMTLQTFIFYRSGLYKMSVVKKHPLDHRPKESVT